MWFRLTSCENDYIDRANILWDQELPLIGNIEHTITLNFRPEVPSAYYQYWKFRSYLSLGDENSYTSGLTAYCQSSGITGIVSHTDPPQSIGARRGLPIYLPLKPGERIISAWTRTNEASGPSLLVSGSL